MKLAALLLFALLGWLGIGIVGVGLSLLRGRRAEAARHGTWLSAVLAGYLIALLLASAFQKQRVVPVAQDQCYGSMCFAVLGTDEATGTLAAAHGTGPDRVIRVSIRVSNYGRSPDSKAHIRAYLVDSRGNTYDPLPGLTGNRLTARVAAGSQAISRPIFMVPQTAAGLALVFTLGHWQTGRLTIGDSDSIAHKPAIVPLPR